MSTKPVKSTPVLEKELEAALSEADSAGKYLVFQLDREQFGIRVLKVREILGIQEITEIPHTPAHVKGIINLRGRIIPLVDLRLKFGLPEQEYSQRTCIIVVEVRGEEGPVATGLVVDGVAEVLNLPVGEIEPAPELGCVATPRYLLGLAKVMGKLKILIDIDHVFNGQDLKELSALA